MLCKRWRNTNDELEPGSFIFVPGFRDKKYQSKTKGDQMDWGNEQICNSITDLISLFQI
jgi:hypothetical protein